MNTIQLLIQKLTRDRSFEVVVRVLPFITKSKNIIDIGSGTGDVTLVLRQKGYQVTPVDVGDYHYPRLVKTVIYDGKKLPFADNSFSRSCASSKRDGDY